MRISIITPSFNQCVFLRRTLDSVLGQRGPFELEWIVIDGGSSDGTIDLLRSIDDRRLRWISEPDRGQSDAINKGMALAGGEVVAWLNSDDLYADGALAAVAEAFRQHPEARWLVGRCDIIDAGDREIRPAITRYKNRRLARYSYRRLLRENFISQPAVFWRRDFGQEMAAGRGLLDDSLHWTMDYDLWLRMGRASPPLVLDRTLARFRLHERSKSGQVDRRQFDEGYAVAARYFNGDRPSRWAHRLNVEKIVTAYRVMRLIGR
jgi:glycosyltransferase involved in cell wall biosynthesis